MCIKYITRATQTDGSVDIVVFLTLFDHIIPFVRSFLTIIRSCKEKPIMKALCEMLWVVHMLGNTNYENALFTFINTLKHTHKNHPKAFNALINNMSACVGVYIKYIHGKLASSLPHHVEPTVDQVNRVLANISERAIVAEKMNAAFDKSRTFWQANIVTQEKYKVTTLQYNNK